MKLEREKLPEASLPGKDKTEKEMNVGICGKAVEVMEKKAVDLESLAQRVKDAQEAMNYAATHFRADALHFQSKELPEIIRELRAARMTITAECSLLLKPLEDLRKFFLGPSHEEEIKRLREFVELCERLKSLKDSGFLDTVADTMLKLS